MVEPDLLILYINVKTFPILPASTQHSRNEGSKLGEITKLCLQRVLQNKIVIELVKGEHIKPHWQDFVLFIT